MGTPGAPALVIAVDPGREKCGLALVREDGVVLRRAVVDSVTCPVLVSAWHEETGARVILGAGTAHRPVRQSLETAGVTPVTVSERDTTRHARERYFRDHPPRGWRRLVPRGLRVPPVPIDDYAAVLIAEAFFAQEARERPGK
ncbi:MAG: pre-16S rRNA-processing nuclease YqgF [Armatimonadetes bacterium]|nr:pre-16S rRNA-processing nuclease YqgF [Armatimonadota bacterium]